MKYFLAALMAGMMVAEANAFDSYQGGDAWGIGTSEGSYRATMHGQYGANAIRRKNGDNITSTTNIITSNGVQNNLSINGDHNNVDGNNLNGENTDSPITTDGQISGRDSGDFNPFKKK